MQPIFDQWTVVLVGSWNVRIFSPLWVGQHLFDSKEVEMEVGIGAGAHPMRYRKSAALIIPRDDRIIFGTTSYRDEALSLLESLSSTTLDLLPHTPISAVGINFGFVEEDPEPDLLKLFDVPDSARLASWATDIHRKELTRQLETKEGIMNLKQVLHDGKVEFHLNFHEDVDSPSKAKESLEGKILRRRDFAIEFLKEVYDLTLEMEEQSNDESE